MQFKLTHKILFFITLLFFNKLLTASVLSHQTIAIHHVIHTMYKQTSTKEDLSHKQLNNKKKSFIKDFESSHSSPWSNAFNFKKMWGTQVDPRTGILAVYVKVGNMLSNLGHGPDIALNVNYSSSVIADIDKLGQGWSWNLTHFNPETNQLSTSSGQTFYLNEEHFHCWKPRYHKLNDLQITGDKSSHFIITYSNGLREILSHDGYETRLEQEDGRGVTFNYIQGTHQLHSISDANGHQIKLIWQANYVAVISQGSYGQPVKVRINNSSRQLQNISLPLQNDKNGPSIHINYLRNMITQLIYPNGLKKELTWNCTDAMKFPEKNKRGRSMCVVTQEKSVPGAEQPPVTTHYKYFQADTNGHDYLAYNSGLTLLANSKNDILFETPADYTYRTEEDDGTITQIRTYDKYHLLIDVRLISNRTKLLLSEKKNYFCRTDEADGCAYTSFENLPPGYSLPLKIVTKTWQTFSEKPIISEMTRSYDNEGRIISSTDEYGRSVKSTYCPVNGDVACPAMPEGWSLSVLLESTTTYPALIPKMPELPVVTTRNYYRKESNLQGNSYLLLLDHQIRKAGDQQIIAIHHYYDDITDKLKYGLLRQSIVQGNSAVTSSSNLSQVIHDYRYTESADGHRKTLFGFIELGYHQYQPSSYVTTSLFTNQILEKTDPSGKDIVRYHYDNWGRSIQIDMASGTPFAVSTKLTYIVSPHLNALIITTPDGLQKKIIFDGMGRLLSKYETQLATTGKPLLGTWKPIISISYDIYGYPFYRKLYLINAKTGSTYTLNALEKYDDLGRVTRLDIPDGEKIFTLYDDVDRCVVSYKQDVQKKRSAISVVRSNILNKPVEMFTLPASSGSLPVARTLCTTGDTAHGAIIFTYKYDGLGRAIMTTDPLKRVLKKRYDALGRNTDIISPNGNILHQQYNLIGKIVAQWILPKTGGKYLLCSAGYNAAGQKLWEAGEDGQRTLFTYTKNRQLATTTTPTGHILSWQYNVLGLPVSQFVDAKITQQMKYDSVTAKPVRKTDNTGTTIYNYTATGLPQQFIHSGKNGYSDYKLQWKYDENERLISNTDISGNQTLKSYDTLGRITKLEYKSVNGDVNSIAVPVYDGFSRIVKDVYGSGISRHIYYDAYGCQSEVADVLNGKLLSQWNFVYDADNNITTLSKKIGDSQWGILNYTYNLQNNLVSMTCTGSDGLTLCPRDTENSGSAFKIPPIITQQSYTFTPLDQLAAVRERLINTVNHHVLSKIVNYNYEHSAPLRIQQISTQWNINTPVIHRFSYDSVGNIVTDGMGNKMTYNLLNQINTVTSSSGKESSYFYNGTGKEVKEITDSATSYLFYSGNSLINEQVSIPGKSQHTIGYLGIAKTVDGKIAEYYESNYKGDISAVLTKDNKGVYTLNHRNIYSPYGMVWHQFKTPSLFFQQIFPGFNGARTNPATGWQFLGQGHRTYNPALRFFVSEDPAGGGYGFAGNNPIMRNDPGGNMPRWCGKALSVLNAIVSFGLGAIHSVWSKIAGGVLAGTLATIGIGVFVLSGGTAVEASAAMLTTALPNILPVASSAIPSNKGLNIASAVAGAIVLVATAAIAVQFGMQATNALLLAKNIASNESSVVEVSSLISDGIPEDEVISNNSTNSSYLTDNSSSSNGILNSSGSDFDSGLVMNHKTTSSIESVAANLTKDISADQVDTFIDQTSEDLQMPALQQTTKISLRRVMRDYSFSQAIAFAEAEAPVYDVNADRELLNNRFFDAYVALLIKVHKGGLSNAQRDILHVNSYEQWKENIQGLFFVNFEKYAEQFYANLMLYRNRINYFGPIYENLQYHPQFIAFASGQLSR